MTISKYFFLFILLNLSTCTGCKEKEWTTLPPETQTGANTFGCYIDGELFVKVHSLFGKILTVNYNTESDKLYINLWGTVNGKDASGNINMVIDTPIEGSTQKFSNAYYRSAQGTPYPPNQDQSKPIQVCYIYGTNNSGTCTITKFDTIQKIVSGQFQFVGFCIDSTNTKKITQGRFDLKMDINNY